MWLASALASSGGASLIVSSDNFSAMQNDGRIQSNLKTYGFYSQKNQRKNRGKTKVSYLLPEHKKV